MQIWTLNLRKSWNFPANPGEAVLHPAVCKVAHRRMFTHLTEDLKKFKKYYFSIFPYPPLLKKSLHDIISVWKQAES